MITVKGRVLLETHRRARVCLWQSVFLDSSKIPGLARDVYDVFLAVHDDLRRRCR